MIPTPEKLPLDLLLRLARREIEDDGPAPALVALHQRPTPEVFDRAAALTTDSDATQRELGVRILRELDGFRTETITLLRARLDDETEPMVLGWIVSALGYHRVHEALPQVVALAGHPDERVRFQVAATLTSLVDLDRVQPEAAEALIRLCHDTDAETRYYALYAATREIAGLDVASVTRVTAELADDSDEQVRAMAIRHHEAIHEVRGLLGDDSLIGFVLVALAGEADAALLQETIRVPPAVAEQLVTWWADRESRIVWN